MAYAHGSNFTFNTAAETVVVILLVLYVYPLAACMGFSFDDPKIIISSKISGYFYCRCGLVGDQFLLIENFLCNQGGLHLIHHDRKQGDLLGSMHVAIADLFWRCVDIFNILCTRSGCKCVAKNLQYSVPQCPSSSTLYDRLCYAHAYKQYRPLVCGTAFHAQLFSQNRTAKRRKVGQLDINSLVPLYPVS